MKMCWKSTHPQVIQDEEEYVSILKQIERNSALHHLLCSEWVPSEGESKQLIKTLIIHTTIVQKLTSNGFFWLKYSNRGSHLTESSIHILLLAPLKKVNRSDSEEKYAQIKHCLIKHFWTYIFLFLISSLDCSDETPLNLEWPEGEWNFIRFSFLGLPFL